MPQIDPRPVCHISVVIPVYNGSQYLEQCLEAVFNSDFPSFEVIAADDHSSDGSAAIAHRFPCTVIQSAVNAGPAATRNAGAREARGRIYFFLDADVLVERDTLTKIARFLAADPDLAALFGSYRKETVPRDFFSRYKNLLHHYTHQHSREDASTFCGGFGAIRREAFQRLGGFDPQRRFLEDIELGYRMKKQGLRVRLCKDLQMTHCKRYTLENLVRSDLFGRAIPWTCLMLENRTFRNDLNTSWNNILSVPVAFLLLLSPGLPAFLFTVPLLVCLFMTLNAGLLSLAWSEGGPLFALQSCLMCWFGYVYSGVGVALGFASYLLNRLKVL
jgi:GT2 family glycosyltransferase